MIVSKPTTIRLGGITYEMRAGTVIPAPVLTYWKATGELARLQTSGAVSDGKETAQDLAAPRARGKSKENAESVRQSES